jgi:hypothetical protein
MLPASSPFHLAMHLPHMPMQAAAVPQLSNIMQGHRISSLNSSKPLGHGCGYGSSFYLRARALVLATPSLLLLACLP